MRLTSRNIAPLNIVSINVLQSKLSCTEFTDFISNYDIVCVDETKTDITDNIVLAGFEVFIKHRCELSRFKSGGISIFVKDKLVNKVKIIDSPNKSCMWMKVKVCTNNQYENLLLEAVYILPENSKYVSNDVFEVLEEEYRYVRFSHDCKYVCLIGDFNARTGTSSDF